MEEAAGGAPVAVRPGPAVDLAQLPDRDGCGGAAAAAVAAGAGVGCRRLPGCFVGLRPATGKALAGARSILQLGRHAPAHPATRG